MTNLAIFLWILNMFLDTLGHLTLKKAASQGNDLNFFEHWKYMAFRPWIWTGIICYVCEFFVWAAFLSQVPLSIGVMIGSFNTVVLVIAGKIFFGEKLTPWRTAGISFITFGVILVGIGV